MVDLYTRSHTRRGRAASRADASVNFDSNSRIESNADAIVHADVLLVNADQGVDDTSFDAVAETDRASSNVTETTTATIDRNIDWNANVYGRGRARLEVDATGAVTRSDGVVLNNGTKGLQSVYAPGETIEVSGLTFDFVEQQSSFSVSPVENPASLDGTASVSGDALFYDQVHVELKNYSSNDMRLRDLNLADYSFDDSSTDKQFWSGGPAGSGGSSVDNRYSNWNAGEPNNSGGVENNAQLRTDGKWNDLAGTSSLSYVLQTNNGTEFIQGAFTYAQAEADAKKRGGTIASIATKAENDEIFELSGGNIWINASDEIEEGNWKRPEKPSVVTVSPDDHSLNIRHFPNSDDTVGGLLIAGNYSGDAGNQLILDGNIYNPSGIVELVNISGPMVTGDSVDGGAGAVPAPVIDAHEAIINASQGEIANLNGEQKIQLRLHRSGLLNPNATVVAGGALEMNVQAHPDDQGRARGIDRLEGSSVDVGLMVWGDTLRFQGPAGYWKLDETSGTRVVDSLGTGMQGIVSGATLGQPGAIRYEADGKSVSFAGDATDSNIKIGADQRLYGGSTQSVTGWINVDSFDKDWQAIYFKGDPGAGATDCDSACTNRENVLWLHNDGSLHARFLQQNSTAQTAVSTSANKVSTGQWHHFASLFDADEKTTAIYMDGVKVASGTLPTNDPLDSKKGAWTLGNSPSGQSKLNGRIDDFAIFNRVLTSDEIKQQYQTGISTTPPEIDTKYIVTGFVGGFEDSNSHREIRSNGDLIINGLDLNEEPLAMNDAIVSMEASVEIGDLDPGKLMIRTNGDITIYEGVDDHLEVVEGAYTFAEAFAEASASGRLLATVHNLVEQRLTEEAAAGSGGWFGATDIFEANQWSWIDGRLIDNVFWIGDYRHGTSVDGYSANWQRDPETGSLTQPDDAYRKQHYLKMQEDGTWSDEDGTETLSYVLETEFDYELREGPFTWADAWLDAFTLGGWIATLETEEEREKVQQLANGSAVWLGASDLENQAVWKWIRPAFEMTPFWSGTSTGSAVNDAYINWNLPTGEPNDFGGHEHYGEFEATGGWNDLSEESTRNYIARKQITKIKTQKMHVGEIVSLNGSVDLNAASHVEIIGKVQTGSDGVFTWNGPGRIVHAVETEELFNTSDILNLKTETLPAELAYATEIEFEYDTTVSQIGIENQMLRDGLVKLAIFENDSPTPVYTSSERSFFRERAFTEKLFHVDDFRFRAGHNYLISAVSDVPADWQIHDLQSASFERYLVTGSGSAINGFDEPRRGDGISSGLAVELFGQDPNPTSPAIISPKIALRGRGGLGTENQSLTTSANQIEGRYPTGAMNVSNIGDLSLKDLEVVHGHMLVVSDSIITVDGPLAVEGGGNLSLIANGERQVYELIDTQMTYEQAVNDAEQRGGTLAIISNATQQADAQTAASGMTAWIGANDIQREGNWVWGDGHDSQQFWQEPVLFWQGASTGLAVDSEYTNWNAGEPNDYNNSEDHAELFGTTGKWNDLNGVNNTRSYVLEKDGQLTYISAFHTYANAVADATSRGGQIAFSDSQEKNEQISQVAGTNSVWINASDAAVEGQWYRPETGYAVNGAYHNWASNQPDNWQNAEDAGQILTDGRWNDTRGGDWNVTLDAQMPVASWAFDEESGTIVNDQTGGGIKGRYENDPTLHVSGAIQSQATEQNRGVDLAGGLSNRVVVIPDNSALYGNTAQTVSGWFKVNSFDKGWQAVYFKGNPGDLETDYTSGGINRESTLWINESGLIQFAFVQQGASGQTAATSGGGAVQAGTWHHFATTFDSATRSAVLYLDGVQKAATTTANSSPLANTAGEWRFGNSPSGQTKLNGPLDDFSIFDRALSASEIKQQYESSRGGRFPYLLGYDASVIVRAPIAASGGDGNINLVGDGGVRIEKDIQFVEMDVNFNEARDDAEKRGGWLAVLHNEEMISEAKAVIGSESALAGGTDASQESQWRWVDAPTVPTGDITNGVTAGMVFWQDGETRNGLVEDWNVETGEPNGGTNENILEVESGGYWNDLSSAATRPGYLLQMPTLQTSGLGQIVVNSGTSYDRGKLISGPNTASIWMEDGSSIVSEHGNLVLLSAHDVGLSNLATEPDADGTGGDILVVADYDGPLGERSDNHGVIYDNLSGNLLNVKSDGVIFSAEGAGEDGAEGVGTTKQPLRTQVTTLTATTDWGDIGILNRGELSVGKVEVQLKGLLSEVLDWRDVVPVTQIPAKMSELYNPIDEGVLVSEPGIFVMGGLAILDNSDIETGSHSIFINSDRGLIVEEDVPVINLEAGNITLGALNLDDPGDAVRFVSGSFTWQEASEDAASKGGKLAAVVNQSAQDFLQTIGQDQPAWIGGSDATSEGDWSWIDSNGKEYLFSVGNFPDLRTYLGRYTNWNQGEPNNYIPVNRVEIQSVEASSQYGNRIADYIINGAGLTSSDSHLIAPDGNMWLSNGTLAQPNDTDPSITFDLGSLQTLDHMRVWNYNEYLVNRPELLERGVARADILIAGEDRQFVVAKSAQAFNKAPGTQADDFSQVINLVGFEARYIKLDNIQAFPGADYQFVGLSEVQFYNRGSDEDYLQLNPNGSWNDLNGMRELGYILQSDAPSNIEVRSNLYSAGGLNTINLLSGYRDFPTLEPLPQQTCDLYHSFTTDQIVSEGTGTYVSLSSCSVPEANMSGSEGEEVPSQAVKYFFSTDQANRDAADYSEGSLSSFASDLVFRTSGRQAVYARVLYADGEFTDYTTFVNVENTSPRDLELTVEEPSGADVRTTQITGGFIDLGTQDTHTARVDWGDGQVDTIPVNAVGESNRNFSMGHTYAEAGHYDVSVIIMDGAGAIVEKQVLQLLPGMRRVGRTLEIFGSNNDDVLELSSNAGLYQLESNLPLSVGSNNPDTMANRAYVELIEPSETDFVILWLGDGADQFEITSGVELVVAAYGGEGNDQLSTSSAEAFFYGEQGEDRLIGGPRNDWLDGGPETDTVDAGSGHDKIVLQDWADVVNGGLGYDEVAVTTTELTSASTLVSPTEANLQGIESIDLFTAANGILQVSPAEVANITDDENHLALRLDDYQRVELDPTWTIQSVARENEFLSRVYTSDDVQLVVIGPLELTNPVNPMDTNNDDLVTASDVLLVINRIASGFTHSGSFPDVDGNGMTTAHDALLVINELDRRSKSAGMEGAAGEFIARDASPLVISGSADITAIAPGSLPNERESELISEIAELLVRDRAVPKPTTSRTQTVHDEEHPMLDATDPTTADSDCHSLDGFFSEYQQKGGKLDIDLFE
ncbi:MAG: lectin-like protein [Rubripirellula sp.]|nr:lectin-like protein [Rubripirellula sp.]